MSNAMTAMEKDRLEHPPMFRDFPTSIARYLAPTDMRATPAQLHAFRAFADKGDELADAVIAEMRQTPADGRRRFEQAVEHGIDAVPDAGPALKAFFREVDTVPFWVDPNKLRLGAETIQRTGLLGAYGALVDVSLMGGYLSHKALKVLVRTGEIGDMAPRRIAETALWWMEVTDVGGLERNAPGFKDTLRVRITHAQIRAAMARKPDWNFSAWDSPINQPQMAGTQLLFSLVGLLALRALGFRFNDEEVDAVIHLWRYAGHLNGVHRDLLPANEADAWRLMWLLAATEFAPDEDSFRLGTALTRALPPLHGIHGDGAVSRAAASVVIGYHSALSRLVLGRANGDALGLPSRPLFLAAVVGGAAANYALETARRVIPGGTKLSVRLGIAARKFAVETLAKDLRPDRSYSRDAGVPSSRETSDASVARREKRQVRSAS